jgi:hypothetical protein
MSKRHKNEHTGGDWEIRIEGTGTGRGPSICVNDRDDPNDLRELADLETAETRVSQARNPRSRWRRKQNYGEIMANARLMKASPKLIAACIQAERVCRMSGLTSTAVMLARAIAATRE